MSKSLQFTVEGKEYTLEFTRKSVQRMEKAGFDIQDLENKPMTLFPMLFHGAFFAHHPFVNQTETSAIYDRLTNKKELVAKLAEMYVEPINSLLDDTEENAGNVDWTASF